MSTYRIVRHYKADYSKRTIEVGLTLEEAQRHCSDPETSSSTCTLPVNRRRTVRCGAWFDGYEEER